MAFQVFTDPASGLSVGNATLNGHWTEATEDAFGWSLDAKFIYDNYDGTLTNTTATTVYGPGDVTNGSHAVALSGLARDRTLTFDFRAQDQDGGFQGGGNRSFKTYANAMAFGTLSSSGVGSTAATVACDFNPNTVDSAASVKVQYKRNADSTWIDGNTSAAQQGESVRNLQFWLSGLQASTLYDFRFVATRDAANDNSLTSGTGQFTTNAGGAPTGVSAFLYLIE